jgi:hypothetical protein
MGGYFWVIGVLVVIAWVLAIVDIVRKRHTRTGAKTAAWILLVIIIPIIGTVTYFLVNGAFGSGGSGTRDPDATRFGR